MMHLIEIERTNQENSAELVIRIMFRHDYVRAHMFFHNPLKLLELN